MTSTFSTKRSSVRLLQGLVPEGDNRDTAAVHLPSPRSVSSPFPGALQHQTSRRRSVCMPNSLFDHPNLLDEPTACGSATAPSSPVPALHRVSVRADSCPAGGSSLTSSAISQAGAEDSDPQRHPSFPLTLLNLHNLGASRRSPRQHPIWETAPHAPPPAFNDASSCLLPDKDDTAGGAGPERGGPEGARSPGARSAAGSCPLLDLCISSPGSSPRRHGTAHGSPVPPLALGCRVGMPIHIPAGSSAPLSPASPGPSPNFRMNTTTAAVAASLTSPMGSMRMATGGGNGAAAASIAAAVPATSLLASPLQTGASSDGAAAGGEGGAALSPTAASSAGVSRVVSLPPGHMSGHRPPTPMCKEDDLLLSLRHMTSPTRRRSRFASAADSSLLAAAAAALAAEEAGLLDTPPRTTGGGGGAATVHSSCYSASGGVAAGARSRRASSTFGSLADVTIGPLSPVRVSAGAGGLGQQAGEAGGARPLGSSTLSRRSMSQLTTVPEEPLAPRSRGEAQPSSSGESSAPGPAAVAGAAGPASGSHGPGSHMGVSTGGIVGSGSGHASGADKAASSASTASRGTLQTCGSASRRARASSSNSSSPNVDLTINPSTAAGAIRSTAGGSGAGGVRGTSCEAAASCHSNCSTAGPRDRSCGSTGAMAGGDACGGVGSQAPSDDSLSSFMHSYEPGAGPAATVTTAGSAAAAVAAAKDAGIFGGGQAVPFLQGGWPSRRDEFIHGRQDHGPLMAAGGRAGGRAGELGAGRVAA